MKKTLLEKLKPFGQEHLLTFWDSLSLSEQQTLSEQIQTLDFAQLAELYAQRNEPAESLKLADKAADPPAFKFSTVTDPTPVKMRQPVSAAEAVSAGSEALKAGQVAVAVVAGGQGTRLGFPHPKGMYPIGPVSNAALFQIHCEKVLATSKRYGYKVPYCIMTSPATHHETVSFLKENRYFGLAEDDVFVFCQGTMPAVDEKTGKVLLDSPSGISLTPDGHGGMLAALSKGTPSILDKLQERGIEYLFYHQVDNPLVRIASPELLGYHILSRSELTSEVIRKSFPAAKVGNVVEVGGRLYVIEYSDLPEEIAKQTNADGSLKIWAGSIAVHIFDIALLNRAAKSSSSLPFHIAKKKVPFIDLQSGERIKPDKENAVKFERFIFDLLPSADNAVVIEVDPPNHYAPVKNAIGSPSETPETSRRALSAMHTDWLKRAGAEIRDGIQIEISPLFADSPEAVVEALKKTNKTAAAYRESVYLR